MAVSERNWFTTEREGFLGDTFPRKRRIGLRGFGLLTRGENHDQRND